MKARVNKRERQEGGGEKESSEIALAPDSRPLFISIIIFEHPEAVHTLPTDRLRYFELRQLII